MRLAVPAIVVSRLGPMKSINMLATIPSLIAPEFRRFKIRCVQVPVGTNVGSIAECTNAIISRSRGRRRVRALVLRTLQVEDSCSPIEHLRPSYIGQSAELHHYRKREMSGKCLDTVEPSFPFQCSHELVFGRAK